MQLVHFPRLVLVLCVTDLCSEVTLILRNEPEGRTVRLSCCQPAAAFWTDELDCCTSVSTANLQDIHACNRALHRPQIHKGPTGAAGQRMFNVNLGGNDYFSLNIYFVCCLTNSI